MKRLLINHTFASTDGQGGVNARIAEGLVERGHELTLIGRDFPTSLCQHPAVRTFEVPTSRAPTRLLKQLRFAQRATRLVARLRDAHDLVIGNGGITFSATDANLCHFVHTSWLRSPHHRGRGWFGSPRAWYQAAYSRHAVVWERHAFRHAGRLVAVSELVKRQLIDDLGVAAEKIHVIENGIDPPTRQDETTRAEARARLGVEADQFAFLFVGDLMTPRKNFDVLLDALPNLPRNVCLIAAGRFTGGPYEPRVRKSRLNDRVRFLGVRKDIRTLYRGADAFVLLSHYEPFGMVVTEALSAGTPVITSASVGAAGVVSRLGAGIVLERQTDVAALVDAVGMLRHDREAARVWGERGKRVVDDLGWPAVVARYERLFESIASDPHRASNAGDAA